MNKFKIVKNKPLKHGNCKCSHCILRRKRSLELMKKTKEPKSKYFINAHGKKKSWKSYEKQLNLKPSKTWSFKCKVCNEYFTKRGLKFHLLKMPIKSLKEEMLKKV